MDWKLEAVALPVTDVDRAKDFYVSQCGFTLDVDHHPNAHFRVVQVTPSGSACSVLFGIGIVSTEPGAVQAIHLVVADIEAARAELAGRGVDVTPVRHMGPNGWVDGVDPAHTAYNSFADFTDPDGNGWVLQEKP